MRTYYYTLKELPGIAKGAVVLVKEQQVAVVNFPSGYMATIAYGRAFMENHPNWFGKIELAEPQLGDEWEEDGVRVPALGEWFSTCGVGDSLECQNETFTGGQPRIILKRKEKPMINEEALAAFDREIQRTKDLALKVEREARNLGEQVDRIASIGH